ncbi:MAG TPA: hypothetical protein VI282_18430 [Verrucomicrobiae bacterium]
MGESHNVRPKFVALTTEGRPVLENEPLAIPTAAMFGANLNAFQHPWRKDNVPAALEFAGDWLHAFELASRKDFRNRSESKRAAGHSANHPAVPNFSL